MTNIITKDGIVVHATDDDIALPTAPAMIEFCPYGAGECIRVGGGDININNSILWTDVFLPQDYENVKYLYNGEWTLNPDFG